MPSTTHRKIRILLADDHHLVREGIRASLINREDLQIVGEASNGREAVQKAVRLAPEVVLMDINMPEMSGLEATAEVRRACPDTKIIALTVHDAREYVLRILRSGAHGYVLKDASPEDLIRAIYVVAEGNAFLSPPISRILLQEYSEVEPPLSAIPAEPDLSARELEVLKLIARGNTSKEVAHKLGVGVRTIDTYRARMMSKINVRNAAELTRWAVERGLVT